MTKKEYLKHKELIDAWANDAKIEYYRADGAWVDVSNPSWDVTNEYRIKPEPVRVPFTFEDREMLRGKWVKPLKQDHELMITMVNTNNVRIGSDLITYSYLMAQYEFIDGTPCSKIQ